jgi:hypothetical protein
MGRVAKWSIVIGGYVAAVVAAGVAGWLYNEHLETLPYDTSGGMYAGGEMLNSLAVFLVVALVPTLLGLWFVRGHAKFWNAVGVLSVGFAAVGLVAVFAATRGAITQNLALVLLSIFGLAQLLGVPFWLFAFVLFAFLAPTRLARRLMIAAIALELVIGVLAFLHWFVPGVRI